MKPSWESWRHTLRQNVDPLGIAVDFAVGRSAAPPTINFHIVGMRKRPTVLPPGAWLSTPERSAAWRRE